MPANVESMFSVREKPWHGLGTIVAEAPDSSAALELAELNWTVVQKDIATADGGKVIPGFKANVRESDDKVLGIVTDRYKVVQNTEAFAFTDALLGEGVRYETAGSLQGGRRIWLLAKLPQQYIINGDEITPYLVFMNSHDGSGSIKVAMTPIRVVCSNTLNLALSKAKRCWSCNHIGNVEWKMDEARATLLYAGQYMTELGKDFARLNLKLWVSGNGRLYHGKAARRRNAPHQLLVRRYECRHKQNFVIAQIQRRVGHHQVAVVNWIEAAAVNSKFQFSLPGYCTSASSSMDSRSAIKELVSRADFSPSVF